MPTVLHFPLLASTQERIRKFFKDLVQESARCNMYINAQKSKIMVVSRQDYISVQVDHEGELKKNDFNEQFIKLEWMHKGVMSIHLVHEGFKSGH